LAGPLLPKLVMCCSFGQNSWTPPPPPKKKNM
jgi:hypothetical protein